MLQTSYWRDGWHWPNVTGPWWTPMCRTDKLNSCQSQSAGHTLLLMWKCHPILIKPPLLQHKQICLATASLDASCVFLCLLLGLSRAACWFKPPGFVAAIRDQTSYGIFLLKVGKIAELKCKLSCSAKLGPAGNRRACVSNQGCIGAQSISTRLF